TYKIFNNFPRAGAVSPVPSSRLLKTQTFNIWVDGLFSKNLQFTRVDDPIAMQDFGDSIGNHTYCNEYHLSQYLTYTKNNVRAVVGAGHFVATYRSDIFESIPKYSQYKMGGDITRIIDLPVVKLGYWRLSTAGNYAKHM